MHKTQDRIKGTKGNKTYQTRRRSNFYYSNGENTGRFYFFVNGITKERRPLTEAQYRDSNYTLNER